MKKNIVLSTVALMICFYGVVATPSVVEAACSYNGYRHSGGKCAVSYKYDENENRGKRDRSNNYRNYTYSSNYSDIGYLQAYIQQLLLLLSSYNQGNGTSQVSDVDVRTRSAIDVDENSATLRATVDMNNEDEADLYFEYGRNSSNFSLRTPTRSLDASDDGETERETISGLEDNTHYYYRAVAIDVSGDKDYGATNSFLTDDIGSSNEDPVVTTQSARSIDSNSAELRGTVDMNDFVNGSAFFVYGEDESQVSDVESDFDRYSDVDEDGDFLQKELINSNVD